MILNLIFFAFLSVLNLLTFWLPQEQVNGVYVLPWGIDSIFVSAVSSFKAMVDVFPPFGIVFDAFLFYLGFKIVIRIVRMIPIVGRYID